MNIKEQIEEEKRRAFLVSDTEFDAKHLFYSASQLIGYRGQITPEYIEIYEVFTDLCTSVEQRLNEIKALIPVPENLEVETTLQQ